MKWTIFSLFVGSSLFAQELTPLQFKRLCETSPLNTFTLTAPTKILGTAPTVTGIDTACRINFANGAKLEADQSAFRFAGPLVFQAGPNAEVTLVKSFLEAPSIQITEGISSSLILSESSVKANAGNITIALGANGQVTGSMPYAMLRNALEAEGSISISGGARATFSLQSTNAVAGAAINLNFAGTEGTLALQDSIVTASGGPFSAVSTGTFANFDISSATINAASGITLSARGREGKVNLSTVGINAGLGSVQIDAGVGANRSGAVKIVSGNIISGGGVTILASRNSTLGEAVLEVSTVQANGDVRVESGSGGTTTVLNNGITSPSLIRVFAPVNGSCVAENNRAVAPTLRLCR